MLQVNAAAGIRTRVIGLGSQCHTTKPQPLIAYLFMEFLDYSLCGFWTTHFVVFGFRYIFYRLNVAVHGTPSAFNVLNLAVFCLRSLYQSHFQVFIVNMSCFTAIIPILMSYIT